MPLSTGTTKAARQGNIEKEIAAGKPIKQAVAIGYAKQRSNSAKKAGDGKKALDSLKATIKRSHL